MNTSGWPSRGNHRPGPRLRSLALVERKTPGGAGSQAEVATTVLTSSGGEVTRPASSESEPRAIEASAWRWRSPARATARMGRPCGQSLPAERRLHGRREPGPRRSLRHRARNSTRRRVCAARAAAAAPVRTARAWRTAAPTARPRPRPRTRAQRGLHHHAAILRESSDPTFRRRA